MAFVNMSVLCSVLSLYLVLNIATAAVAPGTVQLTSDTFDKIVPRFKAVLAKFDKQNPYGDKQKQFKLVGETSVSQKDLLVAEIAVQDRGKKENLELAERYGVKKEDFPAYKLFIQGKEEPVSFTGDVSKADDIKRFVVKETGLWLGLPGCLEDFDPMIKEFLESGNKKAVIERAQHQAEKITDETEKFRAEVYVKTMKNLLEKGNDFVKSELERVERLSEQKVSEAKKSQLKDRASILTSFQMYMHKESAKDEL